EHTSALTDEEILNMIGEAEAVSGAAYFIGIEEARNEELSRKVEELYSVANDAASSDQEAAQALEQIVLLQQQEEAVYHIQDTLSAQYGDAVVVPEDSKWKVVVQAETLEKSEALSIMNLVMTELEV